MRKKRKEDWQLRKVYFTKAIGLFDDDEIIKSVDSSKSYGQERLQALGRTGGIYYLVVYTWRGATRHIITAWKVEKHGKKRYQTLFTQRD